MKRFSFLVVAVLVVGLVAFFSTRALAQEAGEAGYLHDVQNFPDMLHTVPDCADEYSDFLGLAQQLQACKNLEAAKNNLATEQALAGQLGEMKKCKSCKKKMELAQEAAMAYEDNIKTYSKTCPADRIKFAAQYESKIKAVCKKCHKKWPGKLGPNDKTPCD